MRLRRCVVSIRAFLDLSCSGWFPGPPGAGYAGSIEASPLPIDLVVFTQPTKHHRVQSLPYTDVLPVS